jgi:hypothetical protein
MMQKGSVPNMVMTATPQVGDPIMMSKAAAAHVLADLRETGNAGKLPVLTLLRLLQMYAADTFIVSRSLGILEHDSVNDLNALPRSESYDSLKSILTRTHERMLGGSSRDEFVSAVREPLVLLISRNRSNEKPTPDERQKIETFLATFLEFVAAA